MVEERRAVRSSFLWEPKTSRCHKATKAIADYRATPDRVTRSCISQSQHDQSHRPTKIPLLNSCCNLAIPATLFVVAILAPTSSTSYRIFLFPHIAVILAVSTPFSAHLSCRPSCILEGSSSILDSQTIQYISPLWSIANIATIPEAWKVKEVEIINNTRMSCPASNGMR